MKLSPKTLRLVPFVPQYAAGVPEVVRVVCVEYGFTWNDSSYFNDLHDPASYYMERGGMFWVLLDDERVVGTIGVTPHGEDECEMHRLYLLPGYRGQRLGQRLLDVTLEWARARGLRRMILWSDFKLTHAHALYKANGFVIFGDRICADPDKSPEYGFVKEPL